MQTHDAIYVGIQGQVLALNRSTGAELWRTKLKGSEFVNVILDQGRIFASTSGELFCLDTQQGTILWQNRLKGLGRGLVTIATETSRSQVAIQLESAMREQQAAANAAASANVTFQ